MELQLDEDYKLTTDSSKQNFILMKYEEIRDKKTKEVVRKDWVEAGYHGLSIKSVLLQYAKLTQINLEDSTISQLVDSINNLTKHIDKVAQQIKVKFESNE